MFRLRQLLTEVATNDNGAGNSGVGSMPDFRIQNDAWIDTRFLEIVVTHCWPEELSGPVLVRVLVGSVLGGYAEPHLSRITIGVVNWRLPAGRAYKRIGKFAVCTFFEWLTYAIAHELFHLVRASEPGQVNGSDDYGVTLAMYEVILSQVLPINQEEEKLCDAFVVNRVRSWRRSENRVQIGFERREKRAHNKRESSLMNLELRDILEHAKRYPAKPEPNVKDKKVCIPKQELRHGSRAYRPAKGLPGKVDYEPADELELPAEEAQELFKQGLVDVQGGWVDTLWIGELPAYRPWLIDGYNAAGRGLLAFIGDLEKKATQRPDDALKAEPNSKLSPKLAVEDSCGLPVFGPA